MMLADLNRELDAFAKAFDWQSPDQHEGFGAFWKWLNDVCRRRPPPGFGPLAVAAHVVAYFAQKDHESTEWWRELLLEHTDGLQKELQTVRQELQDTQRRLAMLEAR